jgi:hypothetical protein
MQCARCLGRGLVVEADGAAHCGGCGGRLLAGAAAVAMLAERFGIDVEVARGLCAQGPRRLSCPVCGTAMAAITVKGVAVDMCPGCAALWLDRGELGTPASGGGLELDLGRRVVVERVGPSEISARFGRAFRTVRDD